MPDSRLHRFFFNRLLSTAGSESKLSGSQALAVLCSDALSSVAYATDALVLALLAGGTGAVIWSPLVGLLVAITTILLVVCYQCTVRTFSGTGGAYGVAYENLGVFPGLLAAAALLVSFVFMLAVSVSAGVQMLFPVWSGLEHVRVPVAIGLIGLMTMLNLRRDREFLWLSTLVTWGFVAAVLVLLGLGTYHAWDVSAVVPALLPEPSDGRIQLILTSFALGCVALTGLETVAIGVQRFQHPASVRASRLIGSLGVLLVIAVIGVTWLSTIYQLAPRTRDPQHAFVLAQLATRILGDGAWRDIVLVIFSMTLVLAANAGFNGFPWLASRVADDRYLPRQFSHRGDRFFFSNGILGLGVLAAAVVFTVQANVHRLIPYYAVTVFTAFTLSQLGMVAFAIRGGPDGTQPKSQGRAFLHGAGAVVCATVVLVILYSLRRDGVWVVPLALGLMVWMFLKIHRHYLVVGSELRLRGEPLKKMDAIKQMVVVPVSGLHRGILDAVRYALSISKDVRAVYVEIDPIAGARMKKEWEKWCEDVPLVMVQSESRSVIQPLVEYLDDLEKTFQPDGITVVIPEFVTVSRWQGLLHNQTARLIRAALVFTPNRVVTSVRYYLKRT